MSLILEHEANLAIILEDESKFGVPITLINKNDILLDIIIVFFLFFQLVYWLHALLL